MFIAMNRFRIAEGMEAGFESIWRERNSLLEGVPGYREFHLLRSDTTDGCTLFASHVLWDSRADFEAWTNSDAFKKAHGQSRAPEGTYLGHPEFEGFEVVL
jgi:heme-degrading monooxygenase HmoA